MTPGVYNCIYTYRKSLLKPTLLLYAPQTGHLLPDGLTDPDRCIHHHHVQLLSYRRVRGLLVADLGQLRNQTELTLAPRLQRHIEQEATK